MMIWGVNYAITNKSRVRAIESEETVYSLSKSLLGISAFILFLCMAPMGLMLLFPNSLDWGNGLGPGLLMMTGLSIVFPFTVFCSVLVILFKLFGSKTEEDRDQQEYDTDW